MRLNQITLPVHDMKISTNFYRALGFIQIVDTDHYARFECPEGDSTFSLSIQETEHAMSLNSSGAVIYFEHEALDEWVKSLQDKGFHFTQAPTDEKYLWREAVLFDPSGNKIKLYWAGENRLNPPWRVEIRA